MSAARWCTVAPLFYRGRKDLEVPFDLGHGLVLNQVPAWVRGKDIAGQVSGGLRDSLSDVIRYALLAEYEASGFGKAQEDARHRIISSNIAIWLARPSSLGFGILIHARQEGDGSWSRVEVSEPPWLKPHEKDLHSELTTDDLIAARQLLESVVCLGRQGSVWIAVRALWMALCEGIWEVRYVLLWIVVEALFGPEDPREITYRMSHRMAFFLGCDKKSGRELFKDAKEGYGLRSKVVHGMRLHADTGPRVKRYDYLIYRTEQFVREGLTKILGDAELTRVFSSRQREAYLDGLPFSV